MPVWRKSSFSGTGNCLQVAKVGAVVLIRDSNAPDVVLPLSTADWRAFIAGAKNGEFDTPIR